MANKVLFVNGPSQDSSDRFFGWPTSLLYAIAPSINAMEKGNLSLEFVPKIFDPIWSVEGENSDQIKKEFGEILERENVSIVCASAIYDSLYPTLQLFEEAKKINPNVTTILGGPHFDEVHSTKLNDALRGNNPIDFGIAGDGEYILENLLRAISDNSLGDLSPKEIPGRAWIYHGGKKYETSGEPIKLGSLPFMPIDLVDQERHKHDFDIFSEGGQILPTVQMIAQRGCPYSCNFCSERKGLAYPNTRSIDSILGEIELRKSQGFKAIFFDDSTFGAYKSRQGGLRELLKTLSETGMQFGSLNRFNHLREKSIVSAFREAGFTYQYCSVEQFDDSTLRQMNKSQGEEHIRKSIEALTSEGMRLGVSLLYGLPYETERSIKATLDFTKEWVDKGTIVLVSESVLSFHPGTPVGKSKSLDFNRTPINQGFPYDRFEEGQWYHPEHVTSEYLKKILEMSEKRFSEVMVRNRHSWYSSHGLLAK